MEHLSEKQEPNGNQFNLLWMWLSSSQKPKCNVRNQPKHHIGEQRMQRDMPKYINAMEWDGCNTFPINNCFITPPSFSLRSSCWWWLLCYSRKTERNLHSLLWNYVRIETIPFTVNTTTYCWCCWLIQLPPSRQDPNAKGNLNQLYTSLKSKLCVHCKPI